jgi:hypothetical protein
MSSLRALLAVGTILGLPFIALIAFNHQATHVHQTVRLTLSDSHGPLQKSFVGMARASLGPQPECGYPPHDMDYPRSLGTTVADGSFTWRRSVSQIKVSRYESRSRNDFALCLQTKGRWHFLWDGEFGEREIASVAVDCSLDEELNPACTSRVTEFDRAAWWRRVGYYALSLPAMAWGVRLRWRKGLRMRWVASEWSLLAFDLAWSGGIWMLDRDANMAQSIAALLGLWLVSAHLGLSARPDPDSRAGKAA